MWFGFQPRLGDYLVTMWLQKLCAMFMIRLLLQCRPPLGKANKRLSVTRRQQPARKTQDALINDGVLDQMTATN